MKKTIATTLATAGFFTAGLAQAADADLSVKGTLRSGACSVVLDNGGVHDLGPIKPADLATDAITRHPKDFTQLAATLTVTCSTPTKFGLHLEDNRAGTKITENDLYPYGLGTAGGKNIGQHFNAILDPTSNGQPIGILERFESEHPWFPPVNYAMLGPWPGSSLTFTTTGNSDMPAAFEHIEATLETEVWINKSSELDLSQEIRIDGSATLELVYL